jgi:hypothetical protein
MLDGLQRGLSDALDRLDRVGRETLAEIDHAAWNGLHVVRRELRLLRDVVRALLDVGDEASGLFLCGPAVAADAERVARVRATVDAERVGHATCPGPGSGPA